MPATVKPETGTNELGDVTCAKCRENLTTALHVKGYVMDNGQMEWDAAQKEAKDADQGVFVTPKKDGDSVVGIVAGYPYTYQRSFEAKNGRAARVAKRWLVNLVGLDGRVGVVEFSNRNFTQQGEPLAKYVNRAVVKIKAVGQESSKTLQVMYERDPSDAEAKAMKDAVLIDLREVADKAEKWAEEQAATNKTNAAPGEIPF